jgi:metal-responsive CopG/Arc/MetJ family transcriptional regulator
LSARIEKGVAGECLERLTATHYGHHELRSANVHLDPESCLEVAVLRGDTCPVPKLAHAVIAERGVTRGPARVHPDRHPTLIRRIAGIRAFSR